MLFTGQEVRIGKNYAQGLEYGRTQDKGTGFPKTFNVTKLTKGVGRDTATAEANCSGPRRKEALFCSKRNDTVNFVLPTFLENK